MKPVLLCILDGLGLNSNPIGNAVTAAKKPVLDSLFSKAPFTQLVTHGERVGLPSGQMGNSEVGHLNLGAGRVVDQWLLRISQALSGDFLQLSPSYQNLKRNFSATKALHLVGLYSSGGVHSHQEHAKLLIKRVSQDFTGPIYIHLISDGRDCSPNSALAAVQDLENFLNDFKQVKIASITGRFYAMDRDKRWERVGKAYAAIALAKGSACQSASQWLELSYEQGITDEFIEPAIINAAPIEQNHAIIFWNFREDRMREIVAALCSPHFDGFDRSLPSISAERVLCFTEYDHTFKLPYLFEQLDVHNHLGQVISNSGMKQLRVAETEKYPHVTYFFNGGIEKPYVNEYRKVVPSPRDVKTYDLKPEMSANGVTDIVVEALKQGQYDFICVNFANCDMVGHTGNFDATVKAVETVDACLGKILAQLESVGGRALIVADHGNAEQMVSYQDGGAYTAHTTYPVPCILISELKDIKLRDGGSLCDVAPTILKLLGLKQPPEMTGRSLY